MAQSRKYLTPCPDVPHVARMSKVVDAVIILGMIAVIVLGVVFVLGELVFRALTGAL